MGLISWFNSFKREEPEKRIKSSIASSDVTYGVDYPIVNKNWDGEKTVGELGVVIKNIPNYQHLRLRSYDAQMKIDIINIILSRYFSWVVGSGLKLQSEPNKTVLALEGIKVDEKFSENVEARFNVWANSKYSDFSREGNLHSKAMDFYSTAFHGDALVVCRFDDFGLNVQIIDGQHVKTPSQDMIDDVKARGNYEEHGIEFNNKGEHVAYFVLVKSNEKDFFDVGKFQRIEVYGKNTNRKMAWMGYGSKHRIDHKRGISRISHVLEKVNKLDRYIEASVSKAEQSANIIYAFEHNSESTGEDPLADRRKKRLGLNGIGEEEETQTPYQLADSLANKITQTTNNQTFNLPIGAKLVPFQGHVDSNFDAFYRSVFNSIAASVGVPPEVAMQMYNSNYSASRAAINGWGYIVDIDRVGLKNDFYGPIYALFLEYQILNNKIKADGFVEAMNSGDYMITESYKSCRFIGKNMPHIDPLKEIKAIREMLDADLITREQGTENLNMGDWNENYSKRIQEDKKITPKPVENGNTANTSSQ